MKLKRVAALAMAGTMVFSLSACGGGSGDGGGSGSGGDLSVMIWDTYQEAGLKEILADFTEETGIGAEIQVVPWNEYWTFLKQELRAAICRMYSGCIPMSLRDICPTICFWISPIRSQRVT